MQSEIEPNDIVPIHSWCCVPHRVAGREHFFMAQTRVLYRFASSFESILKDLTSEEGRIFYVAEALDILNSAELLRRLLIDV
jgi:hypothetical protein